MIKHGLLACFSLSLSDAFLGSTFLDKLYIEFQVPSRMDPRSQPLNGKVLFLDCSGVAPDSLDISWGGHTSLLSQIHHQHAVLCLVFSDLFCYFVQRLINKHQTP